MQSNYKVIKTAILNNGYLLCVETIFYFFFLLEQCCVLASVYSYNIKSQNTVILLLSPNYFCFIQILLNVEWLPAQPAFRCFCLSLLCLWETTFLSLYIFFSFLWHLPNCSAMRSSFILFSPDTSGITSILCLREPRCFFSTACFW